MYTLDPQGTQAIAQRFAGIGLPVRLDAQAAQRLKQVQPRERILHALGRAEAWQDQGARAFLANALHDARIFVGRPAPKLVSLASDPAMAPVQAALPFVASARSARANSAPPPRPARPRPTLPSRPTTLPARRKDLARAEPHEARLSHHIYGGHAALTFELDETPGGTPTMAIDAAVSVGERKYDWLNKIRLQLTRQEIPVVAAVLLGVLRNCRYTNHGPANDKGLEIQWQANRGTLFVRVWQGKGNLRAIPMTREDAFYVAQILVGAIQQGSLARLDAAGVIAIVRASYGAHQ